MIVREASAMWRRSPVDTKSLLLDRKGKVEKMVVGREALIVSGSGEFMSWVE